MVSMMKLTEVVGWEYGPRPLGPKEIHVDGLLVPPGKASSLV